MRIHLSFLILLGCLPAACVASSDANDADEEIGRETSAASTVWSSLETTANTLIINSSQALDVNAPFYGIQVDLNGQDITDDITDIKTLSPTSWRYTFGTKKVNKSGDSITVSLKNAQLAVPGHYLALGWGAKTVAAVSKRLQDCQAGVGECAGGAPMPGLVNAVKGVSVRYTPRSLATAGGYDFAPVFAAASAAKAAGLRLHVMFTTKTFSQENLFSGNGSTSSFAIPGGWSPTGGRNREVHVYVKNVEVPRITGFVFNADRTKVTLLNPPAPGAKVVVAYAPDPFPESAWAASPPIGGWYVGANPGHLNFGFVHAPWRSTCVAWMKDFMGQFQSQWDEALNDNPGLAQSIEAVSMQETSTTLGGPDYTAEKYIDGLTEYTKFLARAVRRRAVHEQLINGIAGSNVPLGQGLADLSTAIIPWGARLAGPDLFNDNTGPNGTTGLEFSVYQRVHREQHDRALTMIWAQNDTYSEPKPGGGFFTMKQQFEKAKKGAGDSSTAGGHKGLEAEYVFWNMTNPSNGGYGWKDALRVIAQNPTIQTSGNDRNRWRNASSKAPIADQTLTRTNP